MSTSPLLKKEIEAPEKASQPPNHAPAPATADSVPEIESPEMKNKKAGSSSHTALTLNAAWAKMDEGARTFVKGESSETTSSLLKQSTVISSPHDFIVEFLEECAKTMVDEAWRRLGESLVFYGGKSVGTLQATDQPAELNYNQGLGNDLIGEMPLKIAYPALEGYEQKPSTGSDPAATLSRKRKREDEDPKSAKQQIKLFLNPTRPVDVFWCDGLGTITFLGHIQNVPFMRNAIELDIQVNVISYSHQHYNEENRLYYRRWTTEGIVEISVDQPWLEFRRAVRGVILFEAP